MKRFLDEIKTIFVTGFIAIFILGVFLFLFKLVFIDVMGFIFRPLIVWMTGNGFYVDPLTVIFTIITIFIVGAILHYINGSQRIINSTLEKFSPKGEWVVLLNVGDGIDYFAFKIKNVIQRITDGDERLRSIIFCPFSPMPGSGFPIVVVDRDKITPLKMTPRQLLSIIISWGRNTPDILEEANNNKGPEET